MDGLFLETGPWRINTNNETLSLIDGSWSEYANVLYVDQPIGTGFSFANSNSYLTNVTQVPTEFLLFLDEFFKVFPEFSKDDMYIAGESFAGTYIPYIAKAILDRNTANTTENESKYNLRGVAIGNGWIDPISQYNAYYTYSVEHNLISGDSKKLAKKQLDACMVALKAKLTIHQDLCELILETVLENSRQTNGSTTTCLNQYDIRDHSDSFPSCGISWPYELTTIAEYLRRKDVVSAIHATSQQIGWVECSSGVGRGFTGDTSPPAVTLLPDILEQIEVLLYSGDQDLICNHMGTEDMISNLTWNGAKGFKNLTSTPWFVNYTQAGYIISERNLTYVLVYNSSHMVPYDVPVVSADMMYRFIGLAYQNISKFPSSVGYQNDTTDKNHTADDEIWDKYYNAGTATLIIVIFGVIGLGAFVFRGRFIRRRKHHHEQLKDLGSNEMDEIVIETPYRSEDIDHFGDSEDEDDMRSRKPQGKYTDEEERTILTSEEH
ncbi:hypothetical protein Glove_428g80 [Diversispora epigaea]|uniref:Pheromone-processing carboxypeptidase KEX1 n=1 Tax=Diversispora epigaea TaxID=1348612 RepID=A0A397GTF9_9GLOM|nr:hypothetical protein Glove_428g80 [Diversispora epigaea]